MCLDEFSSNNDYVEDDIHDAIKTDHESNQTTIAGNVENGGDFVVRDKTIHGDEIGGDKVDGDKIAPQGYVAIGGQTVHVHLGIPGTSSLSAKEAPDEGKSPYQGLNYFSFEDAHLFFGREQLTAELAAYLRTHHFLAVVGASGSGKSSLVRAGLIPALHYGEPLADGTMPPIGSHHWPIHIMQPKAHPLRELAATLLRDNESDLEHIRLEDELAQDVRVLDRRVSRLLSGGPSDRLLLVVDQFEELFTLCKDPNERKAFVDSLLTAAVEDGVTTVVITLRADFYAYCFAFDNLRAALEGYQKNIGPMLKDELRRAIEEPARLGSWELEPGLVELLLADVGDEPGALPLLSHALLETWKRRRGRTLTLAGYAESGRVQGAIAHTAKAVFNQLATPEQQAIAKNIFLRLTELGEGSEDTRRRVQLAELMPKPQEKATIEAVLTTLADARLVTTDKEEVEVAHEALIRNWPTLRRWLDENREGLRIHRRLTETTQAWLALERDPGELYRGTRLDQTMEWLARHPHDLNEQEQAFLDASQAERQRQIDEQERIAQEIEAARQRDLENAQALAAAAQEKQETEAARAQEAEALRLAEEKLRHAAEQSATESAESAKKLSQRALYLGVALFIAILGVVTTVIFFERAQDSANIANQRISQMRVLLGVDLAQDIVAKREVATLLVQFGEELAAKGDFNGAAANFTRALELDPPSDTPVYVWVEAGEFMMGSTDEDSSPSGNKKPAHQVFVDGFWIGRTEVTNAQYMRCIKAGMCAAPQNDLYENSDLANHPVVNVTWYDVQTYAEWIGGRLPTEAEWEKACRGTDGRIYPWGNESPTYELANYGGSNVSTTAVGSYSAGANDLYDMAGNVWEWTSSQYRSYPYAANDGREDSKGSAIRTLRGGSWPNLANYMQCTYRFDLEPNSSSTGVGFRVVFSSPGF